MKLNNAHPGVIFKREYVRGRREPANRTKQYQLYELANKTGISRQYWGDVFAGRKRVTAKLALLMATVSKENATHWAILQAEYDIMRAQKNKKYRR